MIESTPAIGSQSTSPARAARLIWLIVFLGLITSAFTLVMVRAALAGIAAQRLSLAAASNDVGSLSTQIDRIYTESEQTVQQDLALRQPSGRDRPEFNAVTGMLDSFVKSLVGQSAGWRIKEIRSFLTGLKLLDDQCAAWHQRYGQCQTALDDRKKEVDASLLGLTASLGRVEGRQRLDLALQVRKFRKLSAGEEANKLAQQIIAAMEPGSDIQESWVETSTFAALIERIAGEEELDRLADLKDNVLSTALFRLTSIIARCGATQPVLQRDFQSSLATFQRALLGEGYVIDIEHQTISPGQGGLYLECRQRLELRRRREILREQMARCGEQYKEASAMLDADHAAMKDLAGSETERMLVRNRRTLFFVCIASAAVLVVLGNRISGSVRRQITAVERATASLRESEARIRTIVDTAMDAVVTMDHEGRIVGWNPQATTIFGYSSEETLGRELADLIIPPAVRAAHRAGLEHFMKTGEGRVINRRIEIAAMHRNGSEIPIELAISPLRSGDKISFGAFVRDLTGQKRAEVEREELHNRLLTASRQAGMAEVATGVLHNVGNALNSVNVSNNVVTERLRHSELTSLQKAIEMLRENLPHLPHYLATDDRGRHLPGFLIEVSQCLGDEQKAMMQEMESLGRGLDHIRHIVGAQQMHAKHGVVLQKVRPDELVDTALEMNRESFTKHKIMIDRDLGEELPAMPLDKHKVLQVLVNVISNAKNAVCEGRALERRISVSVQQVLSGSGKVVRFQITDNGMGIAPENIARIFGYGFTTRSAGHGFGLHSAANAAREMGGNLTAASGGTGLGATFTLDLPAEVAAKNAAKPAGLVTATLS